MPVFFLALFVFLLSVVTSGLTTSDNVRQENVASSRRERTTELARITNRYISEHAGVAPATLAALAATPGYEDAAQFLPTTGPHGNGPFLFVTSLNDGTNDYQRVIVYNIPQDGSISKEDYLLAANNKCGTTDATALGEWCGAPTGNWWKTETLQRIPDELSRERLQQQQTLQKFAKVYSHVIVNRQVFPNPGLGDGAAVTLISQIPSFTGSATNCAGTWVWQDVPLTCDDLFTIWGTPRVYNYKNEDFIVLYAEAPWRENGQPIIVASQLDSRR